MIDEEPIAPGTPDDPDGTDLGAGRGQPYIRYPGNKRKIAPTIWKILGQPKILVEPFVGSGAVRLHRPMVRRALLADTSIRLIGLHQRVKADYYQLKFRIRELSLEYPFERYSDLREALNASDPLSRDGAALALLVNLYCFNGVWRTNRAGQFNTPVGDRPRPIPWDALGDAEMTFARDVILHQDFEHTLRLVDQQPASGVAVYCDPPYMPKEIPSGKSFTGYSGEFGVLEHAKLAAWARRLAYDGRTVVVSNFDMPLVREIYKNASEFQTVRVRHAVGAGTGAEQGVDEVLITYRPGLP